MPTLPYRTPAPCCHHWQVAATPTAWGLSRPNVGTVMPSAPSPGIDDQLVFSRALLASLDRVIDTRGPLPDPPDDTMPLILAALALLAATEAPPPPWAASIEPQP